MVFPHYLRQIYKTKIKTQKNNPNQKDLNTNNHKQHNGIEFIHKKPKQK